MVTKQLQTLNSPDGSEYGVLTDGNGNLVVTATLSSGSSKQLSGYHSPDGSLYFTLADGNGNLV